MVISAARRTPARARKGRPDAPENLTMRVTDAIRHSIVDAEFEFGDALAYARADATFHEVIVENSANRYLIESYTLASGRVSALRTRNLSVSTPLRRRSNTAHRAIAAAFERGDLPEAEQLVDEHVLQMAIGFRALRRAESRT